MYVCVCIHIIFLLLYTQVKVTLIFICRHVLLIYYESALNEYFYALFDTFVLIV